MTIDTSPVNLTLDSTILTKELRAMLTLELRTMKGAKHLVHLNHDFPQVATAFLEKPATLGELISFTLRRQHPQIQYIAEMNGVLVSHYSEHLSLQQAFGQIEYDPETKTLHV